MPSSSLAVGADGSILAGFADGRMLVLDGEGKLKWSFAAASAIAGSPVIGPRGNVYFATRNGTIFAIKGHEGLGNLAWPMHRKDARRTAAR